MFLLSLFIKSLPCHLQKRELKISHKHAGIAEVQESENIITNKMLYRMCKQEAYFKAAISLC